MWTEKFSINDALKFGWSSFRQHIGFFIGLMVVLALVTVLPDTIVDKTFEHDSAGFIVCKLILRVIGLMFGMAVTRLSLDITDNGSPNVGAVRELPPLFVSYFFGTVLYAIVVLIGMLPEVLPVAGLAYAKDSPFLAIACLLAMIPFAIPGLYLAYLFIYTPYLIIDRQLGPIEALQESRVITQGAKIHLFLFGLVILGINIVGALLLIIGLFVTFPVTLMAFTYIYRRLSPQGNAPSATAVLPA